MIDGTAPKRNLIRRPVALWASALSAMGLAVVAAWLFGLLVWHGAKAGAKANRAERIAIALVGGAVPDKARARAQRTARGPDFAPGFWRNPAGNFTDPGYALVAAARNSIDLLRLSDGTVMHHYQPDRQKIDEQFGRVRAALDPTIEGAAMPMHAMLMPDGGLMFMDHGALVRIDACGQPAWVRGGYHHAIEPDGEGNFWAPALLVPAARPGAGPDYRDELITRVTADGRRLSQERVSDILDRNGFGALIYGRPYDDDPVHLNDIQPVPGDGPYWKKGDVFLSLRKLSMVLLYRPSTGKIVWQAIGPWQGQHDISILDDHRVMLFDNHVTFGPDDITVGEGGNRVMVYDFATGKAEPVFGPATAYLGARTIQGGRALPLPGGDVMIENTNDGVVGRFDPAGQVRWRYVAANDAGRRLRLGWTRYLDPVTFGNAVAAASAARCPAG